MLPTSARFTYGVYVGRFQPPHRAHLAVMREALAHVGTLVIVLGSARAARSEKNPFTTEERRELVAGALRDEGLPVERVRFTEVRDLWDMDAWADAVRAAVRTVTGPDRDVVLVGHDKDASTTYLRAFPEWAFVPTTVRSPLSATRVRDAWYTLDMETVARDVTPSVAAALGAFARTPDFDTLRAEHGWLRERQATWRGEVPPTTLAAHLLVTNGDRVLLTRRTDLPGRGLLTLPGGPLQPGRTLWASLTRHALEQWGLDLPGRAPGEPLVFDHPDRVPGCREVALVYDLLLEGGGQAYWFALADVLARPERFFADHYRLLEVSLARREERRVPGL